MTLFDIVSVDVLGFRINPNVPVVITARKDSQLTESQRVSATDAAYRKFYKQDEVEVAVAHSKQAPHLKDIHRPKRNVSSDLIKTEVLTASQWDDIVEYDIDDEDEFFLELENARRAEAKEKPLTEDVFERTIDRLEKETHFHTERHAEASTSAPDSTEDVCCVCGDGDVSNVNQIIYCDMCNIAVHQDCYGVPYIPEGQWLCRKCKLSPSTSVHCELCPFQSGAFKQTADGKWAHVVCAIWLNEVHFGNTAFLEPIEGVTNSLRRRCKLRCLVCKLKGGACLQCSKGSCVRSFHVTCAAQAGLQMVVQTQPDDSSPDQVSVKRFVYCHMHGSKMLGDNEFAKNKKKAIEAIRRARRNVVENRDVAPTVSVPLISSEARARIEERVKEKVEEMMLYWYYKRRKRSGVPLIRRLQAWTRQAARKAAAIEPSKELLAVQKGRAAVERSRLLCELMKKRERDKLDHIELSRSIVRQIMLPLDQFLLQLLDRIVEMDQQKVFTSPVVIKGYSDIIKHPMDLSLIRKKIENGEYESVNDMRTHLNLMFKNCQVFNKDGEKFYLKYGSDMKKKVDRELEDATDYLATLESEEMLNELARIDFYEDVAPVKEETKPLKEEIKEEVKRKRKVDDKKGENTLPSSPSPVGTLKKKAKNVSTPQAESTSAPAPLSSSRRSSLFRVGDKDKETPYTTSISSPITRRSSFRNGTTPSFNSYRDACVLSPEMLQSSCESSEESDMDVNRRGYADLRTLADPTTLQHGDLVKVDSGARKVAGMVIDRNMLSIDDPELYKSLGVGLKGGLNGQALFIKVYKENCVKPFDRSAVCLLDVNNDKCDGIEEARREYMSLLCNSKRSAD